MLPLQRRTHVTKIATCCAVKASTKAAPPLPPPPPQLASAPLSNALKLMWQHPPVRGSLICGYTLEMMPMTSASEPDEVRSQTTWCYLRT